MNKKGFTLTELLVVVVILGIVSGLSIPLIRNLTTTFERKKYESYADGVLAASKIYNDSYSEDLFGHNDYGCAYVPYEKLVEKKLIKDIQIDDRSCNSKQTYVRIIKQQDKYAYTVYLGCGKNINGKVSKVDLTIPDDIPEINPEVCTGVDESNLFISTVDAQTGGASDKNRKKTKLKIESATGINSNMIIYAKWSKDAHDFTNTGFEKVSFKVKNNQEKSISEGNIIESISDELISPKSTGAFYLIVRVDRLEDLYGHQWKNTQDSASKYMAFGPFLIDSTEPVITANIYKCKQENDSYVKDGSVITTKTVSSGEETFNLSSMTGTVQGWATSKNFADGVCIEFLLTDDSSIKSATWQWNEQHLKEGTQGYQTFPENNKSPKTYEGDKSVTIYKSLTADGHRYGRLTLKDFAGNKTIMNIDLKLDASGPDVLTVENQYEDKWTRADVTLSLTSSDKYSLHNIGGYHYTYNQNATEYSTSGMDSGTKWVLLRGTIKSPFVTEAWTAAEGTSFNKTVYISSTDTLDNPSELTRMTVIKIDKIKPTVTITNSNNGKWTKNNVSLGIKGVDNDSGISEYYYSYKQNATAYDGSSDADAATKWVKLNGGTNKKEFTTEEIWKTTMKKTVYIRAKDKVGNYSDPVSTNIWIDKTAPKTPTINSPTGWEQNLTMTISSSDNQAGIGTESGIKSYQYTYSGTADDNIVKTNGPDAATYWRIEPGAETSANSYDSYFEQDGEHDVYWRVCDVAGNCSAKTKVHIKIDGTPPSCGSSVWYDPDTQGETYGVSGSVGCSDSQSGCEEDTGYFSGRKSNGYVYIYDNVGNYNSCSISIWEDTCNEEYENQILGGESLWDEWCNRRRETTASNCESENWVNYTKRDGTWIRESGYNGTCWDYCGGGSVYPPPDEFRPVRIVRELVDYDYCYW